MIENINMAQAGDTLYKAMLAIAYPIQQAYVKIVSIIMHLLSIREQCIFIIQWMQTFNSSCRWLSI